MPWISLQPSSPPQVFSVVRRRGSKIPAMSGMLPGVELARRRRASHHHPMAPNSSPRPSDRKFYSLSGAAEGGSYLDENALRARRSLEEKLWSSHPTNTKHRWNGMFSWGRRAMYGSGPTTSTRSEPTVGSAANEGFCLLTAVSDRVSWETEICPVCLDGFHLHQTVMHLPCLHRYHPECLRPWLSAHSDCPYCRTHISSVVG